MPRFRKILGGTSYLIINGQHQKFRKGDIVDCELHEIPEAMRYKWQRIHPKEEGMADPANLTNEERGMTDDNDIHEESPLEMRHRGGGYYDVINTATGEPINDKALRREEALLLLSGENASEEDGGQD